MRRLCLLLILTACDLQPAKKKQDTGSSPTAVATPPTEPPAEPKAEPVKPIKASQECIAVATHLSKLVIDSLIEEAARTDALEKQPASIRSVAETCARDKWSESGRACMLASKTLNDTNLCNVKPPTG